LYLTAFDFATGNVTWTARLGSVSPTDDTCGSGAEDGSIVGFSATPDGSWGLVTGAKQPEVVNLASGALRTDSQAISTLGNYVVDQRRNSPTFTLTEPATGKYVGSFNTDGTKGGIEFYSGDAIAPTGLFLSDSAGSTAPAGLTADGKTLIAIPGSEPDATMTSIEAYPLPSDHPLWRRKEPFGNFAILGDGGGVLVISETAKSGGAHLYGLDDSSGATRWKLPDAQLCAVTSTEMLLLVNGELAVINIQNGNQLSYSSSSNGDYCPNVLPGGLEVETGSGDIIVTQTLQP
jgi:hypothetical protein